MGAGKARYWSVPEPTKEGRAEIDLMKRMLDMTWDRSPGLPRTVSKESDLAWEAMCRRAVQKLYNHDKDSIDEQEI